MKTSYSSCANPGASKSTLGFTPASDRFLRPNVSTSDPAIWRGVLNSLRAAFLWQPDWQAPLTFIRWLLRWRKRAAVRRRLPKPLAGGGR
jgi:hypothetical protein